LELEAFILIGGRSKRFGSDKAFFEFEGEALAARMARLARMAHPGARVRFLGASEEQFGGKTAELDAPTVFDVKTGFGPWSGLHAALTHSTAEWTLILACDLPYITIELQQRLYEECANDVDAVVARQSDGRPQPLCAVYRTEKARPIADQMLTREVLPPLRIICRELDTAFIDVEGDLLRNANTQADLA
jgi:molybdopterin-guanine dinucleotide biosynthesis protein A